MKTQQGRVAEDGEECKDAAGKPILPCAATCKDADGKYVRSSAYVNMFGFKDYKGDSYDGSCSFFGGSAPLPEGLGWFIVLGLLHPRAPWCMSAG